MHDKKDDCNNNNNSYDEKMLVSLQSVSSGLLRNIKKSTERYLS